MEKSVGMFRRAAAGTCDEYARGCDTSVRRRRDRILIFKCVVAKRWKALAVALMPWAVIVGTVYEALEWCGVLEYKARVQGGVGK